MKTIKSLLALCALAVASVFRRPEREECWNEVSTTGTHANGLLPFVTEASFTANRYLLAKKGTADNGIVLSTATARPWGVVQDEPASGVKTTVAVLGAANGTLKVRVNGAVTAGAKLYTAASGKATATYAAGAYCIGIAINAAAADGDLVEFAHILPILDASGTTL